MKCEEIQRKLSAFIDKELKQKDAKLIREHLNKCTGCAEELRAISSAWDFVETAEGIEPSPYFWTKLSARIDEQTTQRAERWSFVKRLFPKPIPIFAAAALVLGVLLGNFVGRMLYPNGSYMNTNGTAEALALNTFDDLPSGSLGEAYYSLLTEGGEQ
ncbi:MAG: anti-sigma factor [Gemmatimonadota bacterium]|nr:MAG: anti-sigma factor [Gemmatimonadota bacterium]